MKTRISLLCLILPMIMLCACSQQQYPDHFFLGSIYTNEYSKKSCITLMDENMDLLYTKKIPIENLETNARARLGDTIYMIANGDSDSKDYGKVLGFNTRTGELQEYSFDRTNITDLLVQDQSIYIISNLNWTFYIDKYDLNTDEVTTIEIKDALVYSFTEKNGRIYALMVADDAKTYLREYDYAKGQWRDISLLPNKEDPVFTDMVFIDDTLYVLVDDHLYTYKLDQLSAESGMESTLETIRLQPDNPYKFYTDGSDLYVIFTDIHGETRSSTIQKYDPETNKMGSEITYQGTIHQLAIKDDAYYIMDFNDMLVLHKDGARLTADQKLPANDNYDYCGGFFNEN